MSDTDVQTPETNKYDNIVDLAIDGNPTGIANSFDQHLKDVLADKLDGLKDQIAQNIFNVSGQSEEEDQQLEPDDEEELTDEEIDSLSDEEWDDLINSIEEEEPEDDE